MTPEAPGGLRLGCDSFEHGFGEVGVPLGDLHRGVAERRAHVFDKRTSTLQCEDGHWVERQSDPYACTSGPGA
ncbi:MAG: hypothetical protein ABI551_04775 [Polyangiaceae bacterium]